MTPLHYALNVMCCQCYHEAYSGRPQQTHYAQNDDLVHFQHRNLYLTGRCYDHYVRSVLERPRIRILVDASHFNTSNIVA